MNTKTIGIAAAVIIVIGIIAYVMTQKSAAPVDQTQNQQTQPATQTQAGASTTPQVQGQDVKVGTGAEATPGSVVSVLYEGKLSDGTTFDSSAAHGNQPLTFQLGSQGIIPGFQVGVNGMKEGGERIVQIPATLGYGAQDVKDAAGKVVIPANSALVFSLRLVKVSASSTAATKPPVKK